MADVQHLKDRGIPLKVDGSVRYVKGATKYTTCGDVIKMVLKKTGIKKEYRHLFAIYEVCRNKENPLPCKSRIVKVIQSWRGEPNRLVLRKSEPLTPIEVKEKRSRWNLKKKSTQHVSESRKLPDIETLTSLVEMVDKHKNRSQRDFCKNGGQSEQFVDSTSDSDSSMDEFLSKLDHSKINGLINFFAALATKKQRRQTYRRSNSGSTNESADSSDSSPERPRRRKVKCSVAKKTKSRSSRSRMMESADVHPNKRHAVQMINFGFIDVEPRSHDKVYSISDGHSSDEQMAAARPLSASKFSARRRLLLAKRQRFSVQEEMCPKQRLKARKTLSDVHFNKFNERFNKRKISGNCQELCCERPICYVDSGHGEDSDSSTDFDNVMSRNDSSDVMNTHKFIIETPEHGRIFQTLASETQITSSARKLVEYSISEDELDASDIMQITTTSETEDDVSDHELHSFRTDNTVFGIKNEISKIDKYALSPYIGNEGEMQKELNNNVTDFIKSVFCKQVTNEDEEMNSFMKSIVLDESSDEGLSSMGSDLEKDVRIRI